MTCNHAHLPCSRLVTMVNIAFETHRKLIFQNGDPQMMAFQQWREEKPLLEERGSVLGVGHSDVLGKYTSGLVSCMVG